MSAQPSSRSGEPLRSETGDGRIDLAHAAGDFTAGDLDPTQAYAFSALAAEDAHIASEAAQWQRLRERLATPAQRGPTPDLTARILRATAWQRDLPPPRRRLLAAAPWLGLAAALLLGIGIGTTASIAMPPRGATTAGTVPVPTPTPTPPEALAFLEDGSEIHAPANVPPERYLPAHHLISARGEANLVRHQATPTSPSDPRPWIGVWIKPTAIPEGGAKPDLPDAQHGHLIVRLAIGSPAAEAGLHVGDILTNVADCPLETPLCLAHALRQYRPGQSVVVRWWSVSERRMRSATLVLAALEE